MVNYCCSKCGKTFGQKSHYKAHMKRKNPCDKGVSLIQNIVDKTVEDKINNLGNHCFAATPVMFRNDD